VLPKLSNFISFPTTLFVDKRGKVREIHAGFTGPATGEFYDEFTDKFQLLVKKLLSE
jgi:hypothetical protein